MRAFDLLAKTEQDIRLAAHPRYHFEMAMLKWMHLRRLVPLADLLDQLGSGGPRRWSRRRVFGPGRRALRRQPGLQTRPEPQRRASTGAAHRPCVEPGLQTRSRAADRSRGPRTAPQAAAQSPPQRAAAPSALKDALLAEIRGGKAFFYNTVIAQAQSIDVSGDTVTFAFLPTHRALREQLEQNRAWIEAAAAARGGPQDRRGVGAGGGGGAPAASGAKPADARAAVGQRQARSQGRGHVVGRRAGRARRLPRRNQGRRGALVA